MTRTPTVAMLGCGTIVRRAHLPNLRVLGARVPVLHGPDSPNSRDLAATFAVPRLVHTVEEALATPGLDAVVVALPTHQHAHAARLAIAAGLPILLEKPVATTIDDARDVVDRADAAKVPIAMCLPQRHRPSMELARRLVEEGVLGRVETVEVRMVRHAGIPGYGGWFTRRELAGGGVLMDLGPHVLDLAMWLAGCWEVRDVRCRVWSTHGPAGTGLGDWGRSRPVEAGRASFDVEDRASLSFGLASGTHVACEVAWAVHGGDEDRVRVVGERGGIDYRPDASDGSPLRLFGEAERRFDGHCFPPDHEDLGPAWSRVMSTLVGDLATGGSRLVGGGHALRVAELIHHAYSIAG